MKKYYIYKITTERLSSEVCILVNASDPKEVAAINKEIDFYNGLTWDSVYGKATASLYEVASAPEGVATFTVSEYFN